MTPSTTLPIEQWMERYAEDGSVLADSLIHQAGLQFPDVDKDVVRKAFRNLLGDGRVRMGSLSFVFSTRSKHMDNLVESIVAFTNIARARSPVGGSVDRVEIVIKSLDSSDDYKVRVGMRAYETDESANPFARAQGYGSTIENAASEALKDFKQRTADELADESHKIAAVRRALAEE